MNPTAFNLWITGTALGFAIHGDMWGAAVGLAAASGITLIINLIPSR